MPFGKTKITIDKQLYQRLGEQAERAGYASTEEFIMHVLEREASGLDEANAEAEVEKQLRGLGYIE